MRKEINELQLTNLKEAKFVRPSTGMMNFMAWLHDGRIDWDELFAEGQAANYKAAMQFVRENCGNSKSSPLTMSDYQLIEFVFKADRSSADLAKLLNTPTHRVSALIGKALKNGFVYTYKAKGETFVALTAFGRSFYTEEVL